MPLLVPERRGGASWRFARLLRALYVHVVCPTDICSLCTLCALVLFEASHMHIHQSDGIIATPLTTPKASPTNSPNPADPRHL